ncbi:MULTISPECIES: sulfur carrier protein ThiS [Tenacibaculum]|uniref:Sulfur carrier protein ThiS n=2 Tax=Tenacibaculum TaxID=104267 RepID=A0AAE9MN95_9FLAO|nr:MULTISPECIES: sulfur carrier protein ThiS [Tenacibaculum]GFD75356.1 thiamine biosynthesis protein ThiS [Tenacibaculum sp. KUL113]GFD80279.1 thiamine biosynthesis protein ThiS [Tenacibaculum sp. KUL118]GFD92294.1 thiamine biosynthesis protein ThiS [Alteromonas sp. KUL154]GFE01761.1 thiamine biosynthesis protein ThiS [Alteromonas sp. KUL156]AZJ31072.1 sulfur carrier protein ThiS [Tenacibaculum mesophilum]
MITIKVNNNQQEFLSPLVLQELVDKLQIKTNGIAIAVNSSVVKKTDWSSKLLQNNDEVLIIKSTQGG